MTIFLTSLLALVNILILKAAGTIRRMEIIEQKFNEAIDRSVLFFCSRDNHMTSVGHTVQSLIQFKGESGELLFKRVNDCYPKNSYDLNLHII